MSDKVSFRYDTKKIAALKDLAYLERKRTSQIIREALDDRLGIGSSDEEINPSSKTGHTSAPK